MSHLDNATSIVLDYLRGDAPRTGPKTSLNLSPAAAGLNYIRGGQSGYNGNPPEGFTKVYWDAQMNGYRQAIATLVDQMAQNPTWMGDNTRIDIVVDHI